MGAVRDGTLLFRNRLACAPWLLHGPFLDKPLPVCGDRAISQCEVIGPIFVTDSTETIHLRSKGLGAKLQLELVVLWSKCESVTKMGEPDFIHDSTIDADFHISTHVRGKDGSPIHCHLHVTAQLNREASMLNLDGLHAGLHGPRAAGPIMEDHFQVLLLVLKDDVGAAAGKLEILSIEGDDVPSGTARAHTRAGPAAATGLLHPNGRLAVGT